MSATQDLTDLEQKRAKAMVAADVETLSALLADDLTWTHASARVDSKPTFLDALKAGRVKYLDIKLSDERIRLHGEMAIITGLTTMRAIVGGEEKSIKNRYMNIWTRRDGSWQMIAWQSTAVPSPQP